jgi:[ribosomal protein S5]-alanine N-acetyltransferase
MDLIFETERLIVRKYTEADEEDFFRLNGDPEIVQYIRAAKTRGDCKIFLLQNITAYSIRPLLGRWAAIEKQTGIYVGSFAVIPIEGSADIQLGYALLKEHWGKGFALELTLAGRQYAFDALELDIIYAITEIPNVASQKVLLKAGFIQMENRKSEGKELYCYYYKRP